MTDRECFETRLVSDGDRGTALVYADWLEEHGQEADDVEYATWLRSDAGFSLVTKSMVFPMKLQSIKVLWSFLQSVRRMMEATQVTAEQFVLSMRPLRDASLNMAELLGTALATRYRFVLEERRETGLPCINVTFDEVGGERTCTYVYDSLAGEKQSSRVETNPIRRFARWLGELGRRRLRGRK